MFCDGEKQEYPKTMFSRMPEKNKEGMTFSYYHLSTKLLFATSVAKCKHFATK